MQQVLRLVELGMVAAAGPQVPHVGVHFIEVAIGGIRGHVERGTLAAGPVKAQN